MNFQRLFLCTLLILTITEIAAQNDTRLYNTWELRKEGMSWSFDDRRDDEVDRGTFTFNLQPSSITDHCSCKVVLKMDFDWRSSDGKILMYYNDHDAFFTVSLINTTGVSEREKTYADENCPIIAKKALAEFKRTFKSDWEHVYSISGNTLNFGGKTLTAVYPVNNSAVGSNTNTNAPPVTSEKTELKNGFHTYVWDNGAKYVGEWKDNKRHGKGTYSASSGDVYIGDWKDDKREGKGTITFANGDVYVGDWLNHQKHGQGTYTWIVGNVYTGEYINGQINGHGTYIEKGGLKYVGEWLNAEKHGQGTQTWPSGNRYTGAWANSVINGHGTFNWSSGSKYEGEWKDEKKHGQGTFLKSDGTKYTGQWLNNEKNGFGTLIWKDGSSYTGQWKNDKMDGHGTFTDSKGEKKTGEFSEGLFIQ